MSDNIPFLDLSGEIELLGESLYGALRDVVRSKKFILGPTVEAFEDEIAKYLGVKHAVGVNSGTDALVISLRAAGVGEGDEVITTPFTYVATAGAISLVGARPVFVDIIPETFNIDPAGIQAAITRQTKAIVPVHLFGQAADMGPILELAQKHDIAIVEDVAQAIGAEFQGKKLGTLGRAGAFSFFPTKNLGAYGDGGLIATDDDQVAEMSRILRTHGSRRKYRSETVGYNSRLDAMQAAILRVKLPHLDAFNEGRRRVAERYGELLGDLTEIDLPQSTWNTATSDTAEPQTGHVYHQYTIRVRGGTRDRVHKQLAQAGIATMVYYPQCLHHAPQYRAQETVLPIAEHACHEVLSLPIWPQLPLPWQEQIACGLRKVVQSTHVSESP